MLGTLGAVAVLVCAGCSAGLQVARGDGAVLMSGLDSSGMDALITGVVGVTEAGCVGIDGGGGVVPTVWPSGTRLTDGGVELDGETVTFGSEVSLGGGEVESLTSEPPQECEAELYYMTWSG